MGPSTGVLPTPPRRRRERTSSTRFRVATSMRWKFIVPTRTCRVCSLLRFDGKKWCFSRLSDSSSPLPVPDRSFFDRFKRSASIQWLGGPMQRATLGVIYTSGEIAIVMHMQPTTAAKVFYSTVATAQLAVNTKTKLSGFVGNLIRQRHSRHRILSQNVQFSTNDGACARRVSSATCTTWVRSLQT